ncbi:hypothetical protein SAZ11_05595 [Streptomyces sp. FXJ1.4098]|nr:hypothetical protein [Streptomyces sp. FXJ1.4098]
MDDAQAILLSDIYPTAWFGAKLAEIGTGDTVVVLGAGPVGQAAIACAGCAVRAGSSSSTGSSTGSNWPSGSTPRPSTSTPRSRCPPSAS